MAGGARSCGASSRPSPCATRWRWSSASSHPTAGAPALALAEIAATLTRAGFAIADLPEVLFEATVLPPACRGSIYTAARVFLRTASERDRLRAREAAACGLEVVDASAPPADLRRVLAGDQPPGSART